MRIYKCLTEKDWLLEAVVQDLRPTRAMEWRLYVRHPKDNGDSVELGGLAADKDDAVTALMSAIDKLRDDLLALRKQVEEAVR